MKRDVKNKLGLVVLLAVQMMLAGCGGGGSIGSSDDPSAAGGTNGSGAGSPSNPSGSGGGITALKSPKMVVPDTVQPYTNQNKMEVKGTCDTSEIVVLREIKSSNGQNVTYEDRTQPCNNDLFSFSVEKAADGQYPFALFQKSSDGQASGEIGLIWTRDTVAPAGANVTDITSSS